MPTKGLSLIGSTTFTINGAGACSILNGVKTAIFYPSQRRSVSSARAAQATQIVKPAYPQNSIRQSCAWLGVGVQPIFP
ncbi:MAG TPA: hypothetical protein VH593_13450 [Ktedonobacteraceae bacterium]